MNAEKLYMMVVDVSDRRLDPDRLRAAIKSEPTISHWWNHLPGLFLLQTRMVTADELSCVMQPALGSVSFIVMEVQPENSEGILPESAWAWVRRRTAETVSRLESSEQAT